MTIPIPGTNPAQRLTELLALYAAPKVCVAELLCDCRDPASVAYRIIAQDLSFQLLTYGELREESERFASVLLALGVQAGDRVATLMGKSREYLVTLMGIWRLGAVHVPLFTAFAPPAIAMRMSGSHAKVLVCDAAQRTKLEPSAGISADPSWRLVTTGVANDDASSFHALMADANRLAAPTVLTSDAPIIHIYTSGTTGRPKAVGVPVKALAAFQAYGEFALGLRPDDVFWNSADPGWAYGLYFGVLATLTTGVESVLLQSGFSPELTYRVLCEQSVTNFTAAPTVYRTMRHAKGVPPQSLRLRCASSAGEPLTPEVNAWAESALGVSVYDHYGQTEAGMLINNHHDPRLTRPMKTGSMGQVMPGWSAIVLHEKEDRPAENGEVGRLAMDTLNSPLSFFAGYLDDPQSSAKKFVGEGRWYLTGDLARVDSDGYYFFGSRDDDVIIMAGYRIGPVEIESVLQSHPAVSESAVIAVPDEIRGEVMEAFVVLREQVQASVELAKELQNWVKQKYAAHAFPRLIHFAESLPKTPSGKIQRYVLRERRRNDNPGGSLPGKTDTPRA